MLKTPTFSRPLRCLWGMGLWGMALSALLPMGAKAERVSFSFIEQATSANDMSPDGRFVVGGSDVDGNGVTDGTYVLDRQTGTQTILPPLGFNAVAVSDDGRVVVGDIPDPTSAGSSVAGRWTADTGWTSLGFLPNAGTCPSRSNSFDVSADGSVVVGLSWDGCSGRAFRWTESEGMAEMEPLANGGNRASVVSGDGSVIAGFAQGSFSRTPSVWNAQGDGQLLDPPGGDLVGEVRGIRDDGSVLLGSLEFPDSGSPATLAARWTETSEGWTSEKVGAGSLIPGWAGAAMDIADDDTVIGFDFLLGNRRAWIQPDGEGTLMELKTYIESNGGTVPAGLLLEVPQAISADGRFIVGSTSFGGGAWLVTISEDCDFDEDGVCDVLDLDALTEAIANTQDPRFDLNGDGQVDLDDRDAWLAEAGALNLASGNAYALGDANLDGAVDGTDFLAWNNHKFQPQSAWSGGDFNADGTVDGSDFLIWNDNKFTTADPFAAVPEPRHAVWLAGLWGWRCRRARRNNKQETERREDSI